MRSSVLAVLALTFANLAALRAAPAAGAAPPALLPHLYLVVEVPESGAPRVLFAARVDLPSTPAAAAPGAGEPALDLIGADGARVATVALAPAALLRGEFHREPGVDGRIEAHHLQARRRLSVVRLPYLAGGALELRGAATTRLEIDALLAAPDRLELAAVGALPGAQADLAAAPDNRLDLLVLGDGYRADQSALFASDVAAIAAELFAEPPLAEYRPAIALSSLFVPSPQAGADHPPYDAACDAWDPACCPDPAAATDPLEGSHADTALDATFCTAGVHRLLTVDYGKALAAAAAAPAWDILLVLVNDPVYGGSGGSLAVASRHASSLAIAIHELGHSFAQLGDEYDYGTPWGCSDTPAPGWCPPNVTDTTQLATLKWAPWVDPATPIPTPETIAWRDAVGLFEGAYYQPTGLYRPRLHCKMELLGVPFCEICRQTFVQRLYEGGWGAPAAGIDPIEPGSESPPPGAVLAAPGVVPIAVDLLAPAGEETLAVEWRVDGELVASGVPELAHAFPADAVATVELRVHDVAGLVHPELERGLLESRREWTVITRLPDCEPSETTACHLGDRFRVEVAWTTLTETGTGRVMSFGGERASSDQSSFWWFFDAANFEMGVKLVDACSPPFDAYWVFVSGLTNQAFTVTVTDTLSGRVRTYSNPLGQYPRTIGATSAETGFPCDP